jgi:hypothetical protein
VTEGEILNLRIFTATICNKFAKADSHILIISGNFRPTTDPQVSNISSDFRPTAVAQILSCLAGERNEVEVNIVLSDPNI